MALTRTTMTAEEATALAALIDKTRLPVHVKRVTDENIVEIQDDNTGYVLPIMSNEHWQQYAKQQGASSALDEFANAGVAIIAHLDGIINDLQKERDEYLLKAEQVDEMVRSYQSKRSTIETAIAAASPLSLPTPPTAQGVTAPAPAIQRTKRPKNMPLQGEWIASRLHQDGRIKISILAVEMSRLYNMPKERASTNISGEMSRLMKSNPQIKRVAPGEFILTIEGKHNG